MKQVLSNPIMVNVELNLIQDIVKIIGQAIHNKFCHDDIDAVKHTLINKAQQAIQAHQNNSDVPAQ